MAGPAQPYGLHGRPAVRPATPTADAGLREQTPRGRSFAALLAEAEAVQDRVEVAPPRGPSGVLSSPAALLARQAPWLGLPLLMRRQRTQGPSGG